MSHIQKRLAFFVPSMRGGGAERSILKLARSIAERGYSVDLVLAQVEGPYLAEIPDSLRVVDLKAPGVLSSLPRLVRYLRRERPEAMLSALNHANIVALWARLLAGSPKRLVVSERSALSVCTENSTKQRGRLMPKLIRRFYPWADGIVAVSEGVAEDLVASTGISRDRIQAIYNPIVTPEFQQKVQDPLEHPWFEPGQPPVILAAGRLRPQKDFPTLIRAFAQVRQWHSARLLILGEGSERPALESLVKELGLAADVSLPGFAANPYPYMTRAAVFVLCSRWEGLPGALIEALYCGIPLISTDCPSGPREVLKDGQYGQLVPVGDANALSQALERVLLERSPSPPPESWTPFEQEVVVDRYLELLIGC
jgi:glycosyltransferase involved in cell wall biosynthesis